MKKPSGRKINLPTIIGAAVMAMIVVFLVWWQMMDRSIKSKEETGKMTELVKKQQEARGMGAGTDSSSVVAADNPADTATAGPAGEGAPPDTAAGSAATGIAGAQPSGQAGGGEGAAEDTTGEKAVSDEVSDATRDAAPAPGEIYYSVHVASFKEMSRAETEMEHLAKEGYETHLLEAEIKGEKWLRVYVGRFGDKETADRARIELLGIKRIGYAKVVKLKY